MPDKTIPVTLPAKVWGRLASIADAQGVKVADVIALAIAQKVHDSLPDNLARLQQGLDEARASGWRAPRRGKTRGTK